MIQLKNIVYKDILRIENLQIFDKQITSIVGESGSGKTTLLRLLNKMISPDQGEIFYQSEPISKMDSIQLRRKVVMLPQAPVIFSGTVRDNLLIGRKFSEQSMVTDERLTDILQMVHLKKDLNEEAELLSGGEKQRVALGRVILMNPEVFLLDEPSSALDEETEELIIEKLVQFTREQNKSLIMVTHSKMMAKRYSDRIIEIKQGQIVLRR